MPRFITPRDYDFMQKINRELFVEVMDNVVILYKANAETTKINLYGESSQKVRYTGVELVATIDYGENDPVDDGYGYDTKQKVEFYFVRRLLEEASVYPEEGDIIKYNDMYHEVFNTSEIELVGSRPEFNSSVKCLTYLTRKSNLNIEERQV